MNAGYSATSYRSWLITQKATNFASPYHRELVAEYDPYAYGLTYTIAQIICANPFTIDGSYSEEEWKERNYNQMIERILTAVLIHGYCVVELSDADPWFEVFVGNEITTIKYDKGTIKSCKVKFSVGGDGYNPAPFEFKGSEKYFWIEFGFKRDRKGIPIIKSIWDALTYDRLIIHNMSHYDMRLGSGFPIVNITDETELTTEKIAAVAAGMDYIDSKKGIIVPQGMEFKMDQHSGSVDFASHDDILLKKISSGSKFPLKWFTGDPKGAVQAAGEDGALIRSRLQSIFGVVKYQILKILRILWPNIKDINPVLIVNEDERESEDILDQNANFDNKEQNQNIKKNTENKEMVENGKQ